MKILGVIPARFRSSRMPGKPLAEILGQPMIWWVWQAAKRSPLLDDLVVATDDGSILAACRSRGIKAVMTRADHDTPTARIQEVSCQLSADLYLQIMGDEPLVDPRAFELILPKAPPADPYYVAGVTNRMERPADVVDFSNQKVVCNARREILMISRSPIPYPKGTADFDYEKITGIQLFSKKALDFYAATPKSALEKAEENDLMRFIENGLTVHAVLSPYKTVSVDTPKDLEIVAEELRRRGEG